MTTKCTATTRTGRPCRGTALANGRCFAHAPELAEARKAGAAKGGRQSSKVERGRRALPSVFARLEQALAETHEGQLPPAVATAMAAIGRALVTLAEHGEIVLRVAKLERRLRGETENDDDNVVEN